MTGDAYDLIGMAVDHRHNLSLVTSLHSSNNTDVNGMIPHSLGYVDDGIGVAPHIHPAHVDSPPPDRLASDRRIQPVVIDPSEGWEAVKGILEPPHLSHR